jgi:hypothetical protein
MRWGVAGSLLIMAGWCVGCEPPPSNAPVAAAVAPGQAKISITRENEESLTFAPVHITVNGSPLVDLAKGQTYTGGIPAGPVSLKAQLDNDWGHYTLHISAVPGKTYTFLVERRVEHALMSMAGFALAGGVGGAAVEVIDTGEQSGRYKITPVSPTQ